MIHLREILLSPAESDERDRYPFAVPAVAIIAATFRYMRGALIFERWGKPPLVPVDEEREKVPGAEPAAEPAVSLPAGRDPAEKPESEGKE